MTDQKLKTLRHAVWTKEHRPSFMEYAAMCSPAFSGTLVTDLQEVTCETCITLVNERWPWTLVTPKKKLVEFLYKLRFDDNEHYTQWSENPKKWCEDNERRYVMNLREVEL